MATIQLPDWLKDRELKDLKAEEEQHRENNFMAPVNFHYQEISTLLLRHSADSFSGIDGTHLYLFSLCMWNDRVHRKMDFVASARKRSQLIP